MVCHSRPASSCAPGPQSLLRLLRPLVSSRGRIRTNARIPQSDEKARSRKRQSGQVPILSGPGECCLTLVDEIRTLPGFDPYRDAGDCVFIEADALFVIDFIENCLTHVEGELAGKPYILSPHERAIAANIFGWKRPDGTRRFREVFLFMPRKNSKSTFCACLICVMLFLDREQGAQIYSAAADREQAGIIFRIVQSMIRNEPELQNRCTVYRKRIVLPERNSWYQAISADAHTKHGFNTSCAAIDEVHAMPNRDLIDVLVTSRGTRTQPLFIYTTTSDYERGGSICNEMYDLAVQWRDGVQTNQSFLPVIYEAGRGDDWTDEAVWAKANPNLGRSFKIDFLREECAKAKMNPAYENTFKRLYLNIRTEQRERWLQMDKWDACTTARPTEARKWREDTLARLGGVQCVGGLDLGQISDLTVLSLLFREANKYTLLPFFWVPRRTALEQEKRARGSYTQWMNQGFIIPMDSEQTDYDQVERDIVQICKRFRVQKLAVDRYFQGAQIAQNLFNAHGLPVEEFGQGFASMAAPTRRFEELVIAGDIDHGMNPVLRWMASNVMVDRDPAGNMKPDRSDVRTQKIDGIVASIMALGVSMTIPNKGRSVYEERGILSL